MSSHLVIAMTPLHPRYSRPIEAAHETHVYVLDYIVLQYIHVSPQLLGPLFHVRDEKQWHPSLPCATAPSPGPGSFSLPEVKPGPVIAQAGANFKHNLAYHEDTLSYV